MKERPILFNDAMVRAILAGAKTQTRRVVMPMPGMQSRWLDVAGIGKSPSLVIDRLGASEPLARWRNRLGAHMAHPGGGPLGWVGCPWDIGDRLWVREAFALSQRDPEDTAVSTREPQWWDPPVYRADGDPGGEWTRFDGRRHVPIRPPWRSARYMPRWASRLTLEITSVRVERVQSISEDDAQAEGLTRHAAGWSAGGDGYDTLTARQAYAELWDEINGEREGCSWAANPWVWAVGFKVV